MLILTGPVFKGYGRSLGDLDDDVKNEVLLKDQVGSGWMVESASRKKDV